MNKLVYNGIDLRDYGLYVSGNKAFDSPEKEYERVSIPGRSGDLFFYSGRFSNTEVSYDAILLPTPFPYQDSKNTEAKFRENAAMIRQILLSPDEYVRIEDDYHPDEYRYGVFIGPFDIEALLLQAGELTLTFDCKPQRWLIKGEEKIELAYNAGTDSQIPFYSKTFNNPTMLGSKPMIYIPFKGSYSVYVRHYTKGEEDRKKIFTVKNAENPIYFDSETVDCYSLIDGEKISANSLVSDFDENTTFYSGTNTVVVSFGPGTSAISEETPYVIPRWYRI